MKAAIAEAGKGKRVVFVGFHVHSALGLTAGIAAADGHRVAIPADCVGTKHRVQGMDADEVQRAVLAVLADGCMTVLASADEIGGGEGGVAKL